MINVLKLIMTRASTRKYNRKAVSAKLVNKILEAGIWGPSIHHIQPWKFVVIKEDKMLKKIPKLICNISERLNLPNFIRHSTIKAISTARVIVCVYNTKEVSSAFSSGKQSKSIIKNLNIVEISSIAASIQNMILVAESFGVGSCWLDTPLFCEEEISKLLKVKGDLMAVLTLGYSAEKSKRAPRKPRREFLKYII